MSAANEEYPPVSCSAWGVLWHSCNRLDGLREYLCRNETTHVPALFLTRAEAREFITDTYGYIRHRADLRREPHGWRLPRAVRVTIMQNAEPEPPQRSGGRQQIVGTLNQKEGDK